MSAPLAGIRVLELANVLAGPSCGQFLAELGADVLKLEPPQGDVTRTWLLPDEQPDARRSAYFCAANWGKQSRCLDLGDLASREALFAMLADADILLMSYKPGDAARFGLAAADLRTRFPRLIIGEISGYGSHDPRVGYDAILQAEAGFTYLNGNNTNDFHKMPVALVDLLAAHQLKQGLLLALYERERTGSGKLVQVALLDAAISSLANQATNYLVAGKVPQPMGSEHPNIVPYGSMYSCKDGEKLVLAVGTDKQFAALCQLLGIALKPGWQHNAERVKARDAVNQVLAEAISQWAITELLVRCQQLHIPCGRVNQMDAVMALAEERGLVLRSGQLASIRQQVFEAVQHELKPAPGFPMA